MNNTPQSGTPRTDAQLDGESDHIFVAHAELRDFARTLERELNEANKHRMEDCSTAVDQSSLVIKVVKERDEARATISELAKQNHKMRYALRLAIEDYNHPWPNEDSETTIHRIHLLQTLISAEKGEDLSSLTVLSRAEVEQLPCWCGGKEGIDVPHECPRCLLLERFTK